MSRVENLRPNNIDKKTTNLKKSTRESLFWLKKDILFNNTQQLETENLKKSTKELLFWLKKDILFNSKETISLDIEKQRTWFGTYLREHGVDKNLFPRKSGIGKFLRTFRYYEDIKTISKKNDVPFRYFFWLKMIEGEGDPTNINISDGGAWISQIQPDTFKWFSSQHLKKNYKVFYDSPKYSAYNYDTLIKQGKSRKEANKIIADKLVQIRKNYGYDLNKLMKLDDRFNPSIALDFSAKYLLFCKSKVNTKTLTNTSRNKYKNDPKYDFEWMLAFNGYNKGPKSFAKNFEWSHISNLKKRIEQYDLYSKRLTDLLKAGYSYDDIMTNITIENPQQRTKKTKQKEISFFSKEKKHTSFSSFERLIKNTNIPLTYINNSKDGKRKVYKYILPTNNNFFAPKDLMQFFRISKIFLWKTIQITDEDWVPLANPLNFPNKKWQAIYVKEKIAK